MEIRRWRIDSGIEIVEAPESIKRRIESYLDKGETFAAVKSIRSYYEETLKRIAKKLEIRVPYRNQQIGILMSFTQESEKNKGVIN